MKKTVWIFFLLAGCFLASSSAMAAVEGTHHDLATYTSGATKDVCYHCHGVKQATDNTTATENFGAIGALCFVRCHSNAGIVTLTKLATQLPEKGEYDNNAATVVKTSYNASPEQKYLGGHGMGDITVAVRNNDSAAASGLPHATDTGIECTSCHDVHSNTNTPFLQAPLSVGSGAATASAALCEKCHQGNARFVDFSLGTLPAPNGGHPVEMDWSTTTYPNGTAGDSGVNTQVARGGTNGRYGRTIVMTKDGVGDNTVFRNRSSNGSALNSPTATYNPGGKLGSFDNVMADNATIGCYTCHAAHIPDAQAGTNNLTVMRGQATASDNVTPLCSGCHGRGVRTPLAALGGAGVTDANPGTTQYYHPVNGEAVSNGGSAGAYTYFTESTGWTITVNPSGPGGNVGVNNRIVCTSCHDLAHGAAASTRMIVREATNEALCNSCHAPSGRYNVDSATANQHHAVGNLNYTSATNPETGRAFAYSATITYNPTQSANLSDGLACSDCHFFGGSQGVAHNWN